MTKIDLSAARNQSADALALQTLLLQLIGQPLLSLNISYGDELKLHLGTPRPYTNPRMKGKTRGSYVIGARGSRWFAHSRPLKTLLIDDGFRKSGEGGQEQVDVHSIEGETFIPAGTVVAGVSTVHDKQGFALILAFEDGSVLYVVPSSDEGDEGEHDGIADWEVFTPYERCVKVGPGLRWSYQDSTAKR